MIRSRLLTAALLSALMTSPAWAGDSTGEHRGQRLDYIFTQMALTDEQRTQTLDVLKTLMEERRTDMQARRQSGEGRPSREQMQALREQHRAELADRLNAVMTEAQTSAFITYLDAHQPRHHRGMRKHHHEQRDPFAETSEGDKE
ncbi:hypothetical protein [Marinimicrobium agarilyticum]|uniref:hypothetical protein n=1 Tax=Marinimicrobium agarilyticum TaxID=306546 RepID=UPI000422141F|nr:hypothetical protein [Marinimicrobium agarilyticum]